MTLDSEQMWGLTELSRGYPPSLNFSDAAAVVLGVGSCQTVLAVELCAAAAAVTTGQALLPRRPPSTALVVGVGRKSMAPSAVCFVDPCETRAWKTESALPFCATQHLLAQKLEMEMAAS